MRGKNRNSIEKRGKLPQFTTMNVIDGQADIVNYASLIFYSLTIDNILNIIVMLILVGVTINVALNGGLFQKAKSAADGTQKQAEKEELMSAAFGTVDNKGELRITKENMEAALSQGWDVKSSNAITDANNETWYPNYKVLLE